MRVTNNNVISNQLLSKNDRMCDCITFTRLCKFAVFYASYNRTLKSLSRAPVKEVQISVLLRTGNSRLLTDDQQNASTDVYFNMKKVTLK